MVCPKCGQISRNKATVCALCGTPLKRERRGGALVAILILALVAVLVGGAILLPRLGVQLPGFPAASATAEPAQVVPADADAAPEAEPVPTALPEPDPADLLWRDVKEIQAAGQLALGLTEEGRVLVAGPERLTGRLDVSDWVGVRQLVALPGGLAGLTQEGRVLLTGDVAGMEPARDWTEVQRLVYSGEALFGITRDGRLFGAGLGMYFNTAALTGVVDLLPSHADSLILFSDGSTRFIPHLGYFAEDGSLRDVAGLAVNSDFGLFLMKDGTVRPSVQYQRLLDWNYMEDPFADWANVYELQLADFYALGLTYDGHVLSAATVPGETPPDTSAWTDVRQICFMRDAVCVFGRTEDGRVLSACPWSAEDPTADWQGVADIALTGRVLAGRCEDGRVLALDLEGGRAIDPSSWEGVQSIALGEGFLLGLREDGVVLFTGRLG